MKKTKHFFKVLKSAILLLYITQHSVVSFATEKWAKNISGNMAITSNYIFRGISQTDNNPAIQGGLTYTFPTGFYLNIWGSNTDYTSPQGKSVNYELDSIIGWQSNPWHDFSYNFSLNHYEFPSARDANYNEANALLDYQFAEVVLSYTGNYSGYHASAAYLNLTLTYELPPQYFKVEGASVAAEAGHYRIAKAAGDSYNDYSFTFNQNINRTYSFSVQWVGTNGRANSPPLDRDQIVGTVMAVF